jgi:hypothetical protein
MIKVKHYPDTIYLETGVFQQSTNFEFRCHNTSKQSALLEGITVKGLDRESKPLWNLFVDSNAMAPSIEVVPKRRIEPGEHLEIFNPITDFPLDYALTRLDFSLRFISKDKDNLQAQLSIDLDVYEQHVDLELPFKGTCLITDGHNFFAHHRRIPLLNPYVIKAGLTANCSRFAYDFTLSDSNGEIYAEEGSKLEHYHGWGKPVFAPGKGRIVSAAHNKPDRERLHQPSFPFAPEEYENFREEAFKELTKIDKNEINGNHVIIDHGNNEFSLIDHMQNDSVTVEVGDIVERGTPIGKIGNSGDSGFPHIHYQLQRGKDIFTSEGLPSRFREFDLLLGDNSRRVRNCYPNTGMIIKRQ